MVPEKMVYCICFSEMEGERFGRTKKGRLEKMDGADYQFILGCADDWHGRHCLCFFPLRTPVYDDAPNRSAQKACLGLLYY